MSKKCILCGESITEDFGKLQGTVIKIKNEKNVNEFLYVCSLCMKDEKWLENAQIKGA
ncbi:hypothetical protein J4456_00950 [Candidatus Pacearchaeota archaeon]|nr:hypothetical protein [Candidatus Pacearchaeota archaeon]